MKRFITVIASLIVINTAFANNNWMPVNKNNSSKISKYLLNKNCIGARNTLIKNGWQPFPAFEGKKFNRDSGPFGMNDDLFIRYPELEHCSPTGFGSCIAGYKKNKFHLTVQYDGAEGGEEFNSKNKYCTANAYMIGLIKDLE